MYHSHNLACMLMGLKTEIKASLKFKGKFSNSVLKNKQLIF